MKKTLFAVLIAVTMLSACGTQTATTPKTPTLTPTPISLPVENQTSCKVPPQLEMNENGEFFEVYIPTPKCDDQLPELLEPVAMTVPYFDAWREVPFGKKVGLHIKPTKIWILWRGWESSHDSLSTVNTVNYDITITRNQFIFSALSTNEVKDVEELYFWLVGEEVGRENFPKKIEMNVIYTLPIDKFINNPFPSP